MVIIPFTGGLGNQLFQYALMLVLKEHYKSQNIKGSKMEYKYVKDHAGGYVLDRVLTEQIGFLNVREEKKYEKLRYMGIVCHCNRLIGKNRKLLKAVSYCERIICENNTCHTVTDYKVPIFNEAVFWLPDIEKQDWYLMGFWQNWNYFKKYEKMIFHKLWLDRIVLNAMQKKLEEKMLHTLSVSIHVRGGDYINNTHFAVCNRKYYDMALKCLEKEIGIKKSDMNIFVFTDDISFAKKMVPHEDITIISNSEPGVDMYLMSKCKHNIIANSTYSFWGAFLNRNKSKKIISPKYFYVLRGGIRTLFSVPDDWIVIQDENVY